MKLLSASDDVNAAYDGRQLRDNTPYTLMFGPDKCGNDHRVHLIFRHVSPRNGSISERKLTRELSERVDEAWRDARPHLFTLVLRAPAQYEVRVDGRTLAQGSLLEDFDPPVNPPAEIDDPQDKRPADWDDREKVSRRWFGRALGPGVLGPPKTALNS